MLHARGAAAPPADAAGEVLDAQRLSDPSLAVVVGGEAGAPVAGYWLVDVDSLERALEIAAAAGVAVEVRPLMSERLGPSAD
ncbi:hypothetical protein GCM10022255_097250 [Dactylosporangium darangshiense]|uniref:YCII-related domain-containing protein n=1 Tax=Dactylosporangium darangshiense TaxID=579108 RepID=A0ABP8DQU4_9ACTN